MSENNVICPFCGEDIPPSSQYCIFCGKDLTEQSLKPAASLVDLDMTVIICKSCGFLIPAYARYCSTCGQSQKHEEPNSLVIKQRMLEAVYISMWGMRDDPEKLFPSGWIGSCSQKQVFALAEAIAKNILIWETVAWNQV